MSEWIEDGVDNGTYFVKHYCPITLLLIKEQILEAIYEKIEAINNNAFDVPYERVNTSCLEYLHLMRCSFKSVEDYFSLINRLEYFFGIPLPSESQLYFPGELLEETINKIKISLLKKIKKIIKNKHEFIKSKSNDLESIRDRFFQYINLYSKHELLQRLDFFIESTSSNIEKLNFLFKVYKEGKRYLSIINERIIILGEVEQIWFKITNNNIYSYRVKGDIVTEIIETVENKLLSLVHPIEFDNEKKLNIVKHYFITKIEEKTIDIDNLDVFIKKYFRVKDSKYNLLDRFKRVTISFRNNTKSSMIIREMHQLFKQLKSPTNNHDIQRSLQLIFINETSGFTYSNIKKYTELKVVGEKKNNRKKIAANS
jgi:hypothetical protein